MDEAQEKTTVAVIGLGKSHHAKPFLARAILHDMKKVHVLILIFYLGGMGIAAVKNMVEEGFDVTGFEKCSYYGGLWHFTEDKQTLSVLECKNLRHFGWKISVLNADNDLATQANIPIERVRAIHSGTKRTVADDKRRCAIPISLFQKVSSSITSKISVVD